MRKLRRSSLLKFSVSLIAVVVAVMAPELRAQVKSAVPQLGKSHTLPAANLASRSTSASQSSAGKSANGLLSLPPHAQGPISAALGKDNSGYWVHRSVKGFRGENPRHALVAEFTRQGAEVRSEARSHNLHWGLETRGYGYGDALHLLKAVAPRAKANRVEYRRDGVTEWYENGPLGLEQGFTLAHPPGKANGQPLTVELALHGDLAAALEPAGVDKKSKGLELRLNDGEAVLRYTGLKARDAMGRELRSWLEVRGERLLVRVDDGGARYPVVVDPWIQQAELTASDGKAGDYFGGSVAVSGSTAVVVGGGRAYVFAESGGTWSQRAELTASDGAAGDDFGGSVALDGSTLIVGAAGHSGGGAAYVFVENGGTWSQRAELTASDGAAGDQFGFSVAVNGSTIVAGAPGQTVGSNQQQGAAYVFVESGGTWSQQAELTLADGAAFDYFGYSVAVSGSTAVVGAPERTVGLVPYAGAAYVFVESGGTWSPQAQLAASDGKPNHCFGCSVALDGSTALVGAPWPLGLSASPGTAYVFVESGGTWSQQAELTASDNAARDYFGWSVAVNGSTIVAGAPGQTVGSNLQGAAYVFVESGGTWSQQAELTAPGAPSDSFGWSVGFSGGTAVVGAPWHASQGAAYVFGSSGPLYTLSATPNSLSVPQGRQGTSTITITPWNGFGGNVSFSASGLPNGLTAAFSPNPATNTSTLTLTASRTAATGTATVFVSGTSGNLTQTTWLTLTVTGVPAVTLSPTSLNFSKQALDERSAARTVTLKNVGGATLDINGITISGDFAVYANTCGATLAAGKTCKVKVTFTPTQLGTRTGTLTFTDDAPDSPQTVALTGIGTSLGLTPPSWNFGSVPVGQTSSAETFTLTNETSSTVGSISISLTGTDRSDFTITNTTCGSTLAGNTSCSINVVFNPQVTGTLTAKLKVSSNGVGSPQFSNLKGMPP